MCVKRWHNWAGILKASFVRRKISFFSLSYSKLTYLLFRGRKSLSWQSSRCCTVRKGGKGIRVATGGNYFWSLFINLVLSTDSRFFFGSLLITVVHEETILPVLWSIFCCSPGTAWLLPGSEPGRLGSVEGLKSHQGLYWVVDKSLSTWINLIQLYRPINNRSIVVQRPHGLALRPHTDHFKFSEDIWSMWATLAYC